MSDKRTPSKCIVVDASIARAAGGLDAKHLNGQRCREFLEVMRAVCHRMAYGARIRAEWDKHRSLFALKWLSSMNQLRKLRVDIDDEPTEELGQAIAESGLEQSIVAIIQKDLHLIAAALRTDQRVASLDDTVRLHLASCCQAIECLRDVHWVNPCDDAQGIVDWLKDGAVDQPRLQLRN